MSGTGIESRKGVKPTEITDEADWDEIAEWLAIGLHNVVVTWSPEVIVIGGGLGSAGVIPLDLVRSKLENTFRYLSSGS